MKINLEYGTSGLQIEVPDKNIVKVLSMQPAVPIQEPQKKLAALLETPVASPPFAELARNKTSACILICDMTRPVPNQIILPPVLKSLEENGIARENITILIATGLHRPNRGAEIDYLVGPEIARNYRIVNHDARNESKQTYLGETANGTPVWLDTTFLAHELRITTGFIEPHWMAGFSGGRKLVCPGVAGMETIRVIHSPRILEHPNAREAVIEGNPLHEEILEIARMAGVDFMVNVALDEARNITGLFVGHPEKAHELGVAFVRKQVTDAISEPVDIVISTSAGYPLDSTYYQAIKGMTVGLPIIKKGGTVILTAECREGLGSPEFARLVREAHDLNKFMADIHSPDYFVIDQWQYEKFVHVMRKVEVILISDKLSYVDQAAMLPVCMESVETALAHCLQKYGPHARIAVIPKGPYVITALTE